MVRPYWHPYRTFAKARWLGRGMLELISTEFRDRSVEYYRYALEAGVTTVNGNPAKPDLIVKNGDRIENIVHRHEPPVTATPVRILHVDAERDFIVVDKPGSIPVHATGRYFKNSLVEILRAEHGIEKPYTVNRLDRLTSGLMIIATSAARARILCDEFLHKAIKKEYIARCIGCFPAEEVICEQPMLTVDRQMGLNIVHPAGKPAKTIFSRLFYDECTDTSVLHCQPVTGRSHQIRVHLQFLGHPIANDPVYADSKVWGQDMGRGGLVFALSSGTEPECSTSAPSPQLQSPPNEGDGGGPFTPQVLAEMGVLAPIGLSTEAVNLLASIRNTHPPAAMVSPAEFGTLTPGELDAGSLSPLDAALSDAQGGTSSSSDTTSARLLPRETGEDIGTASPVPLTVEAVGVISRLRNMKDEGEDWSRWRDVIFRAKAALAPLPHAGDGSVQNDDSPFEPAVHVGADGRATLYCPECYLPLHPDPVPEDLYIFLHAKKYSTPEWSFETDMPVWARPGFRWVSRRR